MASAETPTERKQYGLRLAVSLMKEVKHIGVDKGKPMNELVEEGIRDLLRKYRRK